MDTYKNPNGDWRRSTFEVYFTCPSVNMSSICMTCSRRCHSKRYQEVFFKRRYTKKEINNNNNNNNNIKDICDCSRSIYCKCSWSPIRAVFDKFAHDDNCIGIYIYNMYIYLLLFHFYDVNNFYNI